MPNCAICKRPVTTGIVLCGHCAEDLEPFTLPPELAWFMNRLAEKIVLDDHIFTCSMCALGSCPRKADGLSCRNGVKAWLLSRAEEFFPAQDMRRVG